MALRLTLPLGKDDSVKNLVFTILCRESPLKLVHLTNFITKRYGKSMTFQAVRRATLELVGEGVLVRNKKEFSINKQWVYDTKRELDRLYQDISEAKGIPKNVDSIKGEISVFTFGSLADMMRFWQSITEDWFTNFKKGDPNVNAYQGAHAWEGLLFADKEKSNMGILKRKGILSYALSTGNTSLDRYLWRFYSSLGIKVGFAPSMSSFNRSYYVATYGQTIVQAQYPNRFVDDLDAYFKRTKTIEDMNLQHLSEIVNQKMAIKLTVIKDLAMAKQINKSIISQIEFTK